MYLYKGPDGLPSFRPVPNPQPCQPQGYGFRDLLKDVSLGLGIVFTALSIKKNLRKRR